jgi:polyisoprenoid-binding protein YceI
MLILLLALVQQVPDLPVVRGELRFDARATLGAFTGRTTALGGRIVGALTLAGVRGTIEAPTATLVTGNGRRDRDMWKVLEVERHPTMRFALDSIVASPAAGDSIPAELRGRLTIHGVTRDATFVGSVRRTGSRWSFRGRTLLDVRDYAIGGLTKLFGMFRMEPEIAVMVEITGDQ